MLTIAAFLSGAIFGGLLVMAAWITTSMGPLNQDNRRAWVARNLREFERQQSVWGAPPPC